MIAVALACRPKLLLADEPTTALDATVQIQVLLLLRKLQEQLGMGVVFVTHDLGVAGEIADRVAVMYAGKVVEEGPVGALMGGPLHPYPRGLLGATVHPGHARPAPHHHPRRAALPGARADRLPLRAALPGGGGAGLHRRRAGAALAGAGAGGALHPRPVGDEAAAAAARASRARVTRRGGAPILAPAAIARYGRERNA